MITKVCQFKARQEQGERLVEVFHPGEMEKAAAFFSMNKTAAPMLPEVQAFLEKLKPDPTKIYVLVNALGAGEYWGSNINGDYFSEAALIHEGLDYGYKTFYNAHPFKHHVNKDPNKSFGDVVLAAWHSDMKRVELIIAIDRVRAKSLAAEDVCDKLDRGMFPDVSMGCKVPYDLCSKCLDWKKYRQAQSTFDPARHKTVGMAVLEFHKKNPIQGLSVTRNDYCEHLKTMLNKILEDGTKVYAINDYPRFFDISFVFIGADKTAKVMAKLAFAQPSGGTLVVPSWMVAEELGYRQPETEKEFEKVASSLSDKVDENYALSVPAGALAGAQFGASAAMMRHMREGKKGFPGAGRVGKYALIGGALTAPVGAAWTAYKKREGKEKNGGVDSVRARLREKRAAKLKDAEIVKRVVPQFSGKALPVNRPDIPKDVLDELGKGDLSEALSTPTTMGMILKPKEFQRITIIRMGKKRLADELDKKKLVFPPVPESDDSVPMGPGHFSSILKRLLLPLMEERSLLEPVVRRRIVRVSICSRPSEEGETTNDAEETPFLQKISAAYNGYLDRLDNCLGDVESVVDEHSDLWAAIHGSGLSDGFAKTASGSGSHALVGPLGAGLGISQWAEWQGRRATMDGKDSAGLLTKLAADHPGAFPTVVGLGALHQQGFAIPRRLVNGVIDTVKGGA